MRKYRRAQEDLDDHDGTGSFEARPDHTERMFIANMLREIVREYLPQKETNRNRMDRAKAGEWIFESPEASGRRLIGFEFVCQYLGLDPDQVRQRIKRLEEGSTRMVLYTDLAGRVKKSRWRKEE